MKEGDIKKFIFKNLEKLAFAAATLVILIYLASLALTTSDAKQKVSQLDEVIKKVKERESKTKPPEIPSPDWFKQTKEQFDFVPASECQITWFAHKIPFLPRKVKPIEEEERVHLKPSLTLEPGIYSVTLKWQTNPGNSKIAIVSYKIMRMLSKDPPGKEVVVADNVPPDPPNYTDKNDVQPDETYKYRIEELAKDDENKGKPLKDLLMQSDSCEVTTKSNIEILGDIIRYPEPTKAMVTKLKFIKPDGSEVTEPRGTLVEKDKEIVLYPDEARKRTETGWVVKDLGEENLPTGKKPFIIIVNSRGRTIKYLPDKTPGTPP
jgi:hypothetical protein